MRNDSMDVSSNPSSFLGSKQFLQTAQSFRHQCRICLQKTNNAKSYCNCKGVMKHIHEQCLLTWIKTAQIKSSFGESFCICEICKQEMRLKTAKKCGLRNLNNLCKSIFCCQGQKKYQQIGFMIIFIVLSVLFFVMLQRYLSKFNQVYLILTIVFGVILMLLLICFCFKWIVIIRQEIIGIYQRKIFQDSMKITPV